MKSRFLVIAALLSIPSLKAMEDQKYTIAIVFEQGHSEGSCECKAKKIAARCQKYKENGALQNFDEAIFVQLEQKLLGAKENSPVSSIPVTKVNKPDAEGIFPLQEALKHGCFNKAEALLDGTHGQRAAVKLNFVQKQKNTFVKTLIDSLIETQQKFESTSVEGVNNEHLTKYLQMRGAILLNKMLQAGASTDFHGTQYGNYKIRNLEEFADEQGFGDLGELIRLARDQKYGYMNEIVAMIQDETKRLCQENK